MIPFLIVTSILNLTLGYALAVYVGQSAAKAREAMNVGDGFVNGERGERRAESRQAVWPVEGYVPESGANPSPRDAKSADAVAEGPAGETDAPSAEEMERQLLAGIEDFRTQLAKLRGTSAVEASSLSTVGAPA